MRANIFKSISKVAEFLRPNGVYSTTVDRGISHWMRPYLKSLYKRRQDQGPEPDRPRSVWINWNYDAEIYSFGKRLGEDFKSKTLKTAFTNRSYVEEERQKREKLGMHGDLAQLQLKDNEDLKQKGESIARDYIQVYIRHCFPLLPQEGIDAVVSYLMSEEMMSHLALNLGMKDLLLTQEFPPSNATLAQSFKAVIGALCHDQGLRRTELFVQDFIVAQLANKSIRDIWVVKNPMGMLAEILEKQQRGSPEPRLLWSSGSETILATFMVGIYSDKQLIGKSAGETVTIAEEMAARDSLSRIFNTTTDAPPLPLGEKGHRLQLSGSGKALPHSFESAETQLKQTR